MKRLGTDPYGYQSFAPRHPYVGWGSGQRPLSVAVYSLIDWTHYNAHREARTTQPVGATIVTVMGYRGFPKAAYIDVRRVTPVLLARTGKSTAKREAAHRAQQADYRRRLYKSDGLPYFRRHVSGPDPDDMPKGSRPFEWTETGDWPYYAGQTE